MKRLCGVFALWGLIFTGGGLAALPFPLLFSRPAPVHAQKLVYPDHWLYDDLTALALEQGRVFFTGSALTAAQIELMLREFDEAALSPGGRALYWRIRDYLSAPPWIAIQSDVFSIGMSPRLEPELYYKTNSALDWLYDRNQRRPFLSAPASLSFAAYITMEADLYFGENRRLSEAHNNYCNFPFDTVIEDIQPVDINMPKRAYLSAGFPIGEASGLNFRIGLGDEALERTRGGSVIFSNTMRALPYGSLTLYSPAIQYDAKAMELEVNKYLYLHQFRINLFNRLSLTLIEGVMVNAPFELRYLNPIMIFHGFTGWIDYGRYNEQLGDTSLNPMDSRVGSLLGLAADVRPLKGLRLYGLFAMNEFQIPGFEEDAPPNALAFQLGAECSVPVSSGHWAFGMEGVYTFPYMYVLGHKDWSYYREYHEVNNPSIREWVGSPFGPDSAAALAWADYHRMTKWKLGASFLFAAQGEKSSAAIFSQETEGYAPKKEDARLAAPSGLPVYTYQISLRFQWAPLDWLTARLNPGYTVRANHQHEAGHWEQGFEIAASFTLTPKP